MESQKDYDTDEEYNSESSNFMNIEEMSKTSANLVDPHFWNDFGELFDEEDFT